MNRVLLVLALSLVSITAAIAGNARSDRTARSFRQDMARRRLIPVRRRPVAPPRPRWVTPRIKPSPDPFIILHEYPHRPRPRRRPLR